MEFERDGEFTGFDIELMRALAGELGLEVEVVNSGFDPITSGTALESDQCDIAAASITITPEREKSIGFTEPYFDAEQSLLVKKESGIASLEELEGQVIAVQSGTTGEGYANDNDPGASEIRSFDAPGDLFTALEAGEVDAILQDLPVNGYRSTRDDSVEVVETYPTDEQYGFATAKDNTELLDAVNGALQSLRDSGAYDDLFEEWFGGA
jgi:polar amino acid transport system substrate-binding protein